MPNSFANYHELIFVMSRRSQISDRENWKRAQVRRFDMNIRFLSVAAIAATAMSVMPAFSQNTEIGEEGYRQYCATCHGQTGKGDGAMAEMLTDSIPDLTQLSANNDGVFPMLNVIHVIDGRTGLRGHGGPMPVYGALFDEQAVSPGPYGGPLYVRGRVLSLAYYLEQIQAN